MTQKADLYARTPITPEPDRHVSLGPVIFFQMSKRLRKLGNTWQDFGAEFDALALSVEEFAAELLGQSASTEEVWPQVCLPV